MWRENPRLSQQENKPNILMNHPSIDIQNHHHRKKDYHRNHGTYSSNPTYPLLYSLSSPNNPLLASKSPSPRLNHPLLFLQIPLGDMPITAHPIPIKKKITASLMRHTYTVMSNQDLGSNSRWEVHGPGTGALRSFTTQIRLKAGISPRKTRPSLVPSLEASDPAVPYALSFQVALK